MNRHRENDFDLIVNLLIKEMNYVSRLNQVRYVKRAVRADYILIPVFCNRTVFFAFSLINLLN
jgi:hypothetical protein